MKEFKDIYAQVKALIPVSNELDGMLQEAYKARCAGVSRLYKIVRELEKLLFARGRRGDIAYIEKAKKLKALRPKMGRRTSRAHKTVDEGAQIASITTMRSQACR
jgi:hypothetical protein